MERRVEPELLDALPPQAPRALASRADIKRLNQLMGHARLGARALRAALPGRASRRLLELGAGDGSFLLRIARRLGSDWRGTSVMLLDRHNVVRPETRQGFETLGWSVGLLTSDVSEWVRDSSATAPQPSFTVIIANLFLHQFSFAQLAELFRASAARTELFVAVEPRRSMWGLVASRMVGLLGCNAVTRHDAPASVRAGFAGCELSSIWPAEENWLLHERPVGLFSHLFLARRK